MTVPAQTPSIEYVEDGVTTEFPVPFRYDAPQDILATRVFADGSVTLLSYGSQYGVSVGSGAAGGTLTVTAPAIAGTRLLIKRRTARVQPTKYQTLGKFTAASHEEALDRYAMIAQEQDAELADVEARAPMVPEGETAPAFASLADLADGDLLEYRAGKLQRFESEAFAGKFYAGDAEGRMIPSNGTGGGDPALRGDLANPAAGAAIIMRRGYGTGAEDQTLGGPGKHIVSLFEWVSGSGRQTDILNGEYGGDLSNEWMKALASGESIFVPGRDKKTKYVIDGSLSFVADSQRILGNGATLEFVGQDINANAIEILSGRRDQGNAGLTRLMQEFSGFRIIGPASAAYRNIIFLEEGLFNPRVSRILSESGTGKGYFGQIGEAFLKTDTGPGGRSYVNNLIAEDIYISGIPHNGIAPPAGFWLQSGIEMRFLRCEAFYYEDCWRLGDPNAAGYRQLSNSQFFAPQGEPGHPGFALDNKTAVKIYAGTAMDFYGGRFNPGNNLDKPTSTLNHVGVRFVKPSMYPDPATGALNTDPGDYFAVDTGNGTFTVYFNDAGTPVEFRQGNTAIDGYSFNGGQISLYGSKGYGVSVEGDPSVRHVKFDETVQFHNIEEGKIYRNTGAGHAQIKFAGPDMSVSSAMPRKAAMAAQSRDFAATGSIGAGGELARSYTGLFGMQGVPLLAAASVPNNFLSLYPYRTSTLGGVDLRLGNLSAATRSMLAGKIGFRPFRSEELTGYTGKMHAVGTVPANDFVATTTKAPWAKPNEPLATDFIYPHPSGAQGVRTYSFCEIAGEIITVFYNMRPVAVDLPTAAPLHLWRIRPDFDVYTTIPFDVGTMTANQWVHQQQTGLDVAIGDHVLAWYSGNQDRVWMHGQITAAGVAGVGLKNVKGTPPASTPGGLICIGVYRRPVAM